MESFYTPNNPNFTAEPHWTPPSPSSPEGCQVLSPESSSLSFDKPHFDSSQYVSYPLFNPVQDFVFPEGSCLSPISENRDYACPTTGLDFELLTGSEVSCKYSRDPACEVSESVQHLSRISNYPLGGLNPQPPVCTASSAQQFPAPLSYRFPPAPQVQPSDADYCSPSSTYCSLSRPTGINYGIDSIPTGWNNADHVWSIETAANAFVGSSSHLPSGLGFEYSAQKSTHNGQGFLSQPLYTYSPLLQEDSTTSDLGSCPDACDDEFSLYCQQSATAAEPSRVKSKHTRKLPSVSPSKPNLCRVCGKVYARPSTLKTHLRTHSGERPYRCTECNKSFSQAANLTAHVRTHSGEKPFKCHICYRRFSQSSSVTTHMRTHSGERPYRCRMCKKAFSDSSTLTKHMRIHSGEKPYQCTLCLLRFSQSGNLNRHMRVHVKS